MPVGNGSLAIAGRHFVGADGRVVILRGVNVSGNAKVPPFYPQIREDDLVRLERMGMNVLRLLFVWEAYEPAPDTRNEAYLAAVQAVATAAAAHGIHVIVDFHQDGFSRFATRGCGDGFPLWAISSRGRPCSPDNSDRCWDWPFLMAIDPTMHRSFRDFYSDAEGVRSRFLITLSHVSEAFAHTPGVIGYDLLNEPWGNEKRELTPLYQDATAVIRAQHPSAIIFVEGHLTTNFGLQTKLPRPAFENMAYAPHYYKPSNLILNRWNGGTLTIQQGFSHMTGKAAEWGVPLFVGEFGVHSSVKHGGDYMTDIYDRLDDCLASGAQWNFTPGWTEEKKDGWNGEDYSIVGYGGAPRPNYRLRPYPRHTAGIPLSFRYEEAAPGEERSLVFVWDHRPDLGPSEVFLPDALFPANAIIEVEPADVRVDRDNARQLLLCWAPRGGLATVRIRSGPVR